MIAEVRINKECGGSGKLEAVLLAGRRPTALLELWTVNDKYNFSGCNYYTE